MHPQFFKINTYDTNGCECLHRTSQTANALDRQTVTSWWFHNTFAACLVVGLSPLWVCENKRNVRQDRHDVHCYTHTTLSLLSVHINATVFHQHYKHMTSATACV